MTADPFASYRPLLVEEVDRAVDAVPMHHGAVMRQQLASITESDRALTPGLLCLLTADALAARSEAAMLAATALTLLATMSDVFSTIATGADEQDLLRTWGMPRTLNAGDAFFALAQETLAQSTSLDATQRLRAVRLLDEASRGISDALYLHSGDPQRGLVGAALALGALSAGADDATLQALYDFGAGVDGSVPGADQIEGVSAAAREKIVEALRYVAEASQ